MSDRVRQAFRDQVRWCNQLGSPFTARVCGLCAERLDRSIPIAATILDWPGDPSAFADSVPLRLAGALHFLARQGGPLASLYPPNAPADDALWAGIERALRDDDAVVRSYLASAPQTNEVMRSAALLPGLLQIADRIRLPLDLYEIGASAGLNLILDRYRYDFGGVTWGDSALLLKPRWEGSAPPVSAPLRIRSRHGADLNPIDLRDASSRERLLSYVWPDQTDRLQRLSAAISLWLSDSPTIERADAAQWLQRSTMTQPQPGGARVLMHSVTWSYLPAATQQSITSFMQVLGQRADATTPLAWLRFEMTVKGAELRLATWPGGEDLLLATGHPHATTIRWNT